MGMPSSAVRENQVDSAIQVFSDYGALLEDYAFEQQYGRATVIKEPIGVCGFITPWNYPLLQIAGKVAPAIAAGCTIVLKPSEIAPLNAVVLTEVFDALGLPRGVFNLVNGYGPVAGAAIAKHPEVDMVSFTGSTHAGVSVAKAAADTVKRVTQELGGKSPNIILDDADFETAVTEGVQSCFINSGQCCDAPTRMLVPAERHEEAVAIAKKAAEAMKVGNPDAPSTDLGPLVSAAQLEKVRRLVEKGIEEGALLVTGGPERPEGLPVGYYVRPTVFANVRNDMAIAQQEVFGPVLSIIPYDDEDEAISIANDTEYGLAGYVYSGDAKRARSVAARMRAGQIHINGGEYDPTVPFGGYKMSGNGREFGPWGLEEYLETKAVMGA
jgi:aldehyde dehydrogenase (NAD+)